MNRKFFPSRIIYTLIFLSVSGFLQAQISLNDFYSEYLTAKHRDADYFARISGSPYENAQFMQAVVFLKTQTEPIKAMMRYNNCFDEMEFRQDETEEILVLEDKENIDSIKLNSEIFRFLPYLDSNGKDQSGYFILLFDGKCRLYMKRPREFQDEVIPEGGYQDYKPAAFINKPEEFYFQFNDNPLVLVPRSTKKIFTLLNENGIDPGKVKKPKYNRISLTLFTKSVCSQ